MSFKTVLPAINKWDESVFLLINRKLQNSFFDAVMPFIREPKVWAPLYLFVVVMVVSNFRKKAIFWLVGFALTLTITDTISSKIFKPWIARPRPCGDPDFSQFVHLLANCGGNGSFTSSHAANHFGMAFFLFSTLSSVFPPAKYIFFIWAALVCYAQVYVGVHYPTDIIGGTIVGCIAGWGVGKIHNRYNDLSQTEIANRGSL